MTDYFDQGDLLGFLQSSRGYYGMHTVFPGIYWKKYPNAIQGRDLLKIATQVAAGMRHLAEKNIIHGALCARNALVGNGAADVKIYNYGSLMDSKVRKDECRCLYT